ncbi:MAG TPA: hypothetical protein VNO30_41605 [Kofleriaceae bacterium]|nr:hypothetical protein [Kofleriaceae bacterium]
MRPRSLALLLALTAGCSRGADREPPPPAEADPLESLQRVADHAEKLAAAERTAAAGQRAQLEKLSAEVEALVDAGQLDRAELKAASIRWQPDSTRSKISESEAKLIQQYDERRETIVRVIQRMRAKSP